MALNDADIKYCNMALSEIGADEISAFSDETREARHCNLLYPTLRNSYLQSRNWRFATDQALLAQVSTDPLFGYANAFQLPPELLRLQKINSAAYKYQIAKRQLWTNATTVYVEGLFDIGAENFPDYYVNAFVLKLCVRFSIAILEDESKAKVYLGLFDRENLAARSIDSMQQSPASLHDHAFRLITVRA